MKDTAPTALQRLINEEKGKINYKEGEAFLLHVFWEAPNQLAAERLLDALQKCAKATHRDTPCVPTYFFRFSTSDADLYGDAPKLVKDHAQLAAAIKKLRVGIPRNAVVTDLLKRDIDPSFLELDLSAELPPELQGHKPVAVEFTEVYLDERAFMEHTGSRDYLDGYAIVMSPGLSNHMPTTLRFGNPSQNLVDKILEPILKETVVPLTTNSCVWKKPEQWSETHFIVSIDFQSSSFETHVFSNEFLQACVWLVRFSHPKRSGVSRLMAVFSSFNEKILEIFKEIANLSPLRGEIHMASEDFVQQMRQALIVAGLTSITVNANRSVGYILHDKAADLQSDQ